MPKINNVGFSEITELKQQAFREIAGLQIRIYENILKRFGGTYHYLDIYAGSGIVNGEPGSPVIFLDLVRETTMRVKSWFIEKEAGNIEELKRACCTYPEQIQPTIMHGDNQQVLPQIRLDRRSSGLLYADPNGIFDDVLLADFADRCPKMDILINCNSTAIKRSEAVFHYDNLIQRIEKIKKTKWIIRENGGKSQWAFLLGSSWSNFPDWKNRGFYSLESTEGRRIIEKLSTTRKFVQEKNQQDFDWGE